MEKIYEFSAHTLFNLPDGRTIRNDSLGFVYAPTYDEALKIYQEMHPNMNPIFLDLHNPPINMPSGMILFRTQRSPTKVIEN